MNLSEDDESATQLALDGGECMQTPTFLMIFVHLASRRSVSLILGSHVCKT